MPILPFMFPSALRYGFLIFLLTVPAVMAQEKLEVIPLKNKRVEGDSHHSPTVGA